MHFEFVAFKLSNMFEYRYVTRCIRYICYIKMFCRLFINLSIVLMAACVYLMRLKQFSTMMVNLCCSLLVKIPGCCAIRPRPQRKS